MDPENQERFFNHCRIHQFLTHATKHLHNIFYKRWEIYYKLNSNFVNQWNNNEASGKELLQFCSPVAKKMKEALQTGNVEEWDVTLTNRAIQAVSDEIRKCGEKIDKNEDELIKSLKEVRNDIVHTLKPELSDDEYTKYLHQLEDILTKFGEDIAKIEKLKENLKNIAEPESEFASLKEKANKLFAEGNYVKAITVYNQILQLQHTTPENQAIIYSNRSAAYLKMEGDDSLKMGKRDAEWAIKLWPCWWKGYYRLGCAEAKLREFIEAAKNLEKSLALNPKSKEILDEISNVRREFGIISRGEHLRPAHQPVSYNSVKEEMCRRNGFTKEIYDKTITVAMNTPYGDIVKGHQFRDGEGVSQDYAKAAQYYAKAANAGIPEGMYNLARLYETGKGIAQNYDESLRWLLKAANEKTLWRVSHMKQGTENMDHVQTSVILDKIKFNPQRKIIITKNHENFIKLAENSNPSQNNTVPKPANSPKPPKLASLKPISLKDMNPTKDKVYDGYVLEAKIIDWPILLKAINTTIEDENGDIKRLAVYNWPSKGDRKNDIAEAIRTFRPNVNVSIINPYFRLSADMQSIIRVENPVYIRLDDTSADNKCTFCGREAKVLSCSGCMMAKYCLKDCQKTDWIDFKHKNMCKHLKNYLM